jgi:hypothetical protein
MPFPDTPIPPEQGLFWAPWWGLSSASRNHGLVLARGARLGWTRTPAGGLGGDLLVLVLLLVLVVLLVKGGGKDCCARLPGSCCARYQHRCQ